MARGIPDQVAENRQDVARLNGQLVVVPDRIQQNLRFLRNTVSITVTAEVYTRDLNDSLVSGHPNGTVHGSGQGVSGDQRGPWGQVTSEATETWTVEGRNAVRDALDGDSAGRINATAVGTGTADAQVTDTTLAAESGDTFAYGVRDANNEVRARSHYLFDEAGDGSPALDEVGLEAGDGRLMARATLTSTVGQTQEQEVRVDITATISGSDSGNSAVTDNGEATVADSIQTQGQSIGFAKIAWGTGTPTIDDTTTALTNEVLRKDAIGTREYESLRLSSPQFAFEPSTQPHDHTEAGVYDSEGRLAWIVDFTDSPFPKDENTEFTTVVGFRFV